MIRWQICYVKRRTSLGSIALPKAGTSALKKHRFGQPSTKQ